MNNYTYRILKEEELSNALKTITHFDHAEAIFPSSLEDVRKNGACEMDKFAVACFDQGNLVGMAGIIDRDERNEKLSVIYYGVDQQYRNQGLAKKLTAAAILIEKENNPETTITTIISPKNPMSQRVISHFGFYNTGIIYYLDHIPKNRSKYPIYDEGEKIKIQCLAKPKLSNNRLKGYFFLKEPLKESQYWLIKEYSYLKYIDSHTIGFEGASFHDKKTIDSISHYDACEELCTTIYQETWNRIQKENPNLATYQIAERVLKEESTIAAFEMSKNYLGVSIILPEDTDKIDREQWNHFLKLYSDEVIKEYELVMLVYISEDNNRKMNVVEQNTCTNKKILSNITEEKRNTKIKTKTVV